MKQTGRGERSYTSLFLRLDRLLSLRNDSYTYCIIVYWVISGMEQFVKLFAGKVKRITYFG